MAHRLIAAVLLVALSTGCATPYVVRLDTGQGAPREYKPPTSTQPVRVDEATFEDALEELVLALPLTVSAPQEGRVVRVSILSTDADARWQRLMSKSFGGLCEPGQLRESCLSLLDDVMGLSSWDKLGVALGLSVDPLKESISQAVEKTLAPQLFYTVIATGLITWAVLAANPEPVFTKAAATLSAILLICMGVEVFLEVVDASRELKLATDRATTWQELETASQRFATRVGPEVARIFVLAATVVVSHGMLGGAALLSSRLPMLPSFSEATAGASRLGIRLADVGQVRAVAVVGSTVIIALPAAAVAVAAQSMEGGAAVEISTAAFKSWGSFSGLKSALGSAGAGKNWHHVVEQTPGNVEQFGAHAIHNTENVIPLEQPLHSRVSAFYSSIRERITGSPSLTVRQWLSTQSYQAQRQFGLKTVEKLRNGEWQ